MNKVILLSITILSVVINFSCKKKSPPAPAPATPSHVNVYSAKINNQPWALGYDMGSPILSVSKYNNNYSFGAQDNDDANSTFTSIRISTTYTLGTCNLLKFNVISATLSKHLPGGVWTTFTSQTGTINITSFDTAAANQGVIKALKATFSFKTDTVNNQSYQVTEGTIDLKDL